MRSAGKRFIYYLSLSYFIFAGVILWGDSHGRLEKLHILAQKATTPVEERLFRAKTVTLGRFGDKRTSEEKDKRISELEVRSAQLEGQIAQFGALKEENERMRYLLGAGLPANWKFEPLRATQNYTDRLYTSAELQELQGKTVISTEGKDGIYVGRVEKIIGNQAEIFLPTKDGERMPVKVRDKDIGEARASGILVGRGGRMVLDQVLTGESLKSQDLVVTSGDESRPNGLLIGRVGKILPVSAGAFQQAEVEQAIDYKQLDVVFVITKF